MVRSDTTLASPVRGAQGWEEDKIRRLDRSPTVVSRGAWGEEKSWEVSGSPPAADASSAESQKATSTPCATLAVGRTRTNMHHSIRQASVRTSPFQQAVIRVPAAVQPGQAPRDVWYLMGAREGAVCAAREGYADGTYAAAAGSRYSQADVCADDEGLDRLPDEGSRSRLARGGRLGGRPGLGPRGRRRRH